MGFSSFFAKRGVKNRTLTPDPRTFTKMSPIFLQTPLVSCWHQRGAFGNPFSGRDFHPAHLGTSRHKLGVQGCLDISYQGSYILECNILLWGKSCHRDGWPKIKLTVRGLTRKFVVTYKSCQYHLQGACFPSPNCSCLLLSF